MLPYHPECKLKIRHSDTCLKMSANDYDEWCKEVTARHEKKEIKFHSECYFLGLHSHHLSVIPTIRKYIKRARMIREYTRIAEDLGQVAESNPLRRRRMLARLEQQNRQLASAKSTAEAGLFENLSSSLKFYLFHIKQLLVSVGGKLVEEFVEINLPLSTEVPKLFAAFPEWYIEDVAEFLLFTIQVN